MSQFILFYICLLGLGCIGVKSSATLHYQLRAADKVVASLADLSVDDILDVVVRSYSRARYTEVTNIRIYYIFDSLQKNVWL